MPTDTLFSMLRDRTRRDTMKRPESLRGSGYVRAAEIIEMLGISRQTLWRWRQEGRIPPGSMYQDRVLVFTVPEAALIRAFAERIVPLSPSKAISRARSRT